MSCCYSSMYNMYMYMYLAGYVGIIVNNFKCKMQQESDLLGMVTFRGDH